MLWVRYFIVVGACLLGGLYAADAVMSPSAPATTKAATPGDGASQLRQLATRKSVAASSAPIVFAETAPVAVPQERLRWEAQLTYRTEPRMVADAQARMGDQDAIPVAASAPASPVATKVAKPASKVAARKSKPNSAEARLASAMPLHPQAPQPARRADNGLFGGFFAPFNWN